MDVTKDTQKLVKDSEKNISAGLEAAAPISILKNLVRATKPAKVIFI